MKDYVAARKYASSRREGWRPPSRSYTEPFLADKSEPLPYLEVLCNVRRLRPKWAARVHQLYLAKTRTSQGDAVRASQFILPFSIRIQPPNKSKDFFDDATMEYVRHNLFRLSSIEGVVTSGPPAAITFRSIVKGKRKTEAGRVNYLLSWSPENIVPDVWVSEEELVSEKTIPVSQLPLNTGALQHLLPAMDALGLSNQRKRKRK